LLALQGEASLLSALGGLQGLHSDGLILEMFSFISGIITNQRDRITRFITRIMA